MNQSNSIRFKFFLPAIAWFITSFILLAMPGDDLPDVGLFDIPFFDKYVHFGMFFLLTFLFSWPFSKTNINLQPWKLMSIRIAVYSIVYGVAMEFVQKYFVKGRSFDMFDILFDSMGSAGGLLGIWKWFFLTKNKWPHLPS